MNCYILSFIIFKKKVHPDAPPQKKKLIGFLFPIHQTHPVAGERINEYFPYSPLRIGRGSQPSQRQISKKSLYEGALIFYFPFFLISSIHLFIFIFIFLKGRFSLTSFFSREYLVPNCHIMDERVLINAQSI